MRPLIAPSVLACDFGRLAEEVAQVTQAGADWIHVDVMDGQFVPNISIGPAVVKAIRSATDLPLDVHLMIMEPDRYLKEFADAGATYLTVHAEATARLYRTVSQIRALGMRPGVVLSPASPLELVTEVLHELEIVLLMTVEPGFGGQQLISSVLDKVERLRRLVQQKGLKLHIEVDGGIDASTAGDALRAGADVLVAGTSIYGTKDYARAIKALRDCAQGAES